jgi:hypothetical protein
MNRKKRAIAAFSFTGITLLSVAIVALGSGCELIVHLDRSLADAGSDDVVLGVCAICSNVEGGEEDAEDGEVGTDAGDATPAADADAGLTSDGEAGRD